MAQQGHILIVDDEIPTLKLLGMALERDGYRISAAQDAATALQRVEADPPDLAILDVMLPGVSGLDLVRQLRARRDTANLPIILLSAKGEVADRIAGLQAGADEYLMKPIDTRELAARVTSLLERTRRLRADAGTRAAHTIAFVGAKGGVGTTSLVVNLGVALAMEQEDVIAVELRGQTGTMPILLGLKSGRGIADFAQADPQAITPTAIGQRLHRHASGLQVLFAPEAMEADLLPEPQAAAIVLALAAKADILLVDLPSIPTPAVRAALPRSQKVILVVEPLRESLERATAMAPLLSGLAGPGVDGRVLICSRAPIASPISAAEIGERIGWPVVGAIPPAPDEFLRAANLGRPILQIQTEGVLAQSLRQVAVALRA